MFSARRPVCPGSVHSALVELKFHGSSFLAASSRRPREDVANVLRGNRACRTCRARRLRVSSRGCPQQVARVGIVEFVERHDTRTNRQHYTPLADQSGKRVANWTGNSPDTRDILITSSRGCRACRSRRLGCHESGTRKLLPWNLSLTTLVSRSASMSRLDTSAGQYHDQPRRTASHLNVFNSGVLTTTSNPDICPPSTEVQQLTHCRRALR